MRYANAPRNGKTIRPITHRALPQPEISCRRNRSVKIMMSSQNHTTNTNTVTTSVRKFAKLKPSFSRHCDPSLSSFDGADLVSIYALGQSPQKKIQNMWVGTHSKVAYLNST